MARKSKTSPKPIACAVAAAIIFWNQKAEVRQI
jgi:hypothetical protein